MKLLFLKFTALRFSCILLLGWLYFHPSVNLPKKVVGGQIIVYGLIVIITLYIAIHLFQKQAIKLNPLISILDLSLYGILIGVVSEAIFLLIRAIDLSLSDLTRLAYFLYNGISVNFVFSTIMAVIGAYRIKKKQQVVLSASRNE